jgi:hypothetical protein
MFNKRVKITKEMMSQLRPTSKAALKHQCLFITNGDLDKAAKLYDFMIKDMEDLPLFDPPRPSTFEQAKVMLGDGFNWAKENQETIMNWVGFFRSMFSKGGGAEAGAEAASQIFPPINQ